MNAESIERELVRGVREHTTKPIAELDVLEIGCGSGSGLVRLVSIGVDPNRLHGIDLQEIAIEEARAQVPSAHLLVGDASTLPYANEAFDLIYQATAFSSMPSPAMRVRVAAEMRRVSRPGATIVSYDFAWNPLNRDTVGITTAELRRLFPGSEIEAHHVTLIPPLARWLGDRSIRLTRLVAKLRPLKSHRLAFIDVRRK
jgi:ubiquinone/menaquinone biosynthesis C-methylase UbiE